LIPRVTGLGGLLFTCIMAGAIVAHLTRLHTPVMALVPLVLLLLSATVAWYDRLQLRRILGQMIPGVGFEESASGHATIK